MTMLDKLGPMGWWVNENESVHRTMYFEQATLGAMQDAVPDRFVARPAKVADNQILTSVLERQRKDGIDDGLDLTYLEPVIYQNRWIEWLAQLIGSCVASGGMRVATARMFWEIVVLGQPEETLGKAWEGRDNISHFAPYSYRAGRKFAGINGNSDGSYCSAHVKGFMEYGFLPCDTQTLTSDAYPEPQNQSLYRQWGANDTLLNKFAAHGKVFDLLESEQVTDAEVAKDRLVTGYKPMMICSGWGFQPDYKHAEWVLDGQPVWIYKRSGSWAHNMSILAIIYAFGKWWVKVKNSWGMKAHRNGDFFIIPFGLFASWLRDAQCMTIGDLDLRDSEIPLSW